MSLGVIGLLVLGALIVFGGYSKHLLDTGEANGAAKCAASVAAKQGELTELGKKFTDEQANHVADMETVAEKVEQETKDALSKTKAKGSSDVAKYPVFQNPACVLPADSLANVNAARASFHGGVIAPVGVQHLAPDNGSSAGARPAPDPGKTDAAVRGPVADTKGDARGNVSTDAGGRRPLGKVR